MILYFFVISTKESLATANKRNKSHLMFDKLFVIHMRFLFRRNNKIVVLRRFDFAQRDNLKLQT